MNAVAAARSGAKSSRLRELFSVRRTTIVKEAGYPSDVKASAPSRRTVGFVVAAVVLAVLVPLATGVVISDEEQAPRRVRHPRAVK